MLCGPTTVCATRTVVIPTADLYSNIVSVEATGDLEVTFTLESPNPFFLYDLSDNHALVIKNGTEDATDFNGTGPFVLSNYSPRGPRGNGCQ